MLVLNQPSIINTLKSARYFIAGDFHENELHFQGGWTSDFQYLSYAGISVDGLSFFSGEEGFYVKKKYFHENHQRNVNVASYLYLCCDNSFG